MTREPDQSFSFVNVASPGASADADRALVPSGPEPQSVSADSGNGPLREKTRLEEIGERLLQICREHANDPEPGLPMLAKVCWALDLYPRIDFREATRPALGIEAGTGETHSGSTEGESPTLEEGNAQ